MEITLSRLLEGKPTIIKGKEYLATKEYVSPFIDEMSKYTDKFHRTVIHSQKFWSVALARKCHPKKFRTIVMGRKYHSKKNDSVVTRLTESYYKKRTVVLRSTESFQK